MAASVDMKADQWAQEDVVGVPLPVVSADGTSVSVSYAAAVFPDGGKLKLAAGAVGDGAAFAGNYFAAGIKGLSLQLDRAEGAVDVQITLRCMDDVNGAAFVYTGLEPNAQGVVSVPIEIPGNRCPEGWRYLRGKDWHAEWASQLQHVNTLGVTVEREDKNAASVTVSDVELKGNDFVYPSGLFVDTDGDGMSDLAEQAAGTDANDAQDVFQAELEDVAGAGVTIRWRCVPGGTYKVERAGSMNGTFVEIATVVAPDADYATYTDGSAKGDGPYFYRVSKQ